MVGVVEIGAKSRQRQAVLASLAKVCQRGTEGGEAERDREREKYIDAAEKDQAGYPEERGGQDGRIRAKACRAGNTNGHHEYRVVVTQAERWWWWWWRRGRQVAGSKPE